MRRRQVRKARATAISDGHTVQFIPGGFYHLVGDALLTGVHRRPASLAMQIKLLPLAQAARKHAGEWVWLKKKIA